SVAITNMTGASFAVNTPGALLLVLRDRDHDGLPDQWEIDHGLNPDDPSDGAADSDGDGMSNAAEYIAGTDYLDPSSYLKSTVTKTNLAIIQFQAIAGRTYSVLYRDAAETGPWQRL